METTIRVPKAFSVRNDEEFTAFGHLMARLNPCLRVTFVAKGCHVYGGYPVYWGIVHMEGQRLTKTQLDTALAEAGFDFAQTEPYLDYSLASDGA